MIRSFQPELRRSFTLASKRLDDPWKLESRDAHTVHPSADRLPEEFELRGGIGERRLAIMLSAK